MRIRLKVNSPPTIGLSVSTVAPVGLSVSSPVVIREDTIPVYGGPTTFTPTAGEQIVPTAGYKLTTDIVINPIPSNWGLITWNGSTITVS